MEGGGGGTFPYEATEQFEYDVLIDSRLYAHETSASFMTIQAVHNHIRNNYANICDCYQDKKQLVREYQAILADDTYE